MKKKYVFNVSMSNNHTAETEETVEIEFEGNETEEEIEQIVSKEFELWLYGEETIRTSWWEVE